MNLSKEEKISKLEVLISEGKSLFVTGSYEQPDYTYMGDGPKTQYYSDVDHDAYPGWRMKSLATLENFLKGESKYVKEFEENCKSSSTESNLRQGIGVLEAVKSGYQDGFIHDQESESNLKSGFIMKKSDRKRRLVEELAQNLKLLNVVKLYEEPDHQSSKNWLAEVAAILKNLDETDFINFENLRQHLYLSIPFSTRKHAAEQIDGFVRKKVAEYKRYDFSYLDREISDYPEDITNYIHDKELRERCLDLLKAEAKFDRAINQATQVLEDKIRIKSNIKTKLEGVKLINTVINNDLDKTLLIISREPDEQQGFSDICRGIMLSFRNQTHHYLSDKITREEAFKVCAFIDTLLPLIENAVLKSEEDKKGEVGT